MSNAQILIATLFKIRVLSRVWIFQIWRGSENMGKKKPKPKTKTQNPQSLTLFSVVGFACTQQITEQKNPAHQAQSPKSPLKQTLIKTRCLLRQ